MSEHILEVRHLSKAFGSHAVLKDIDFTVDKGDVTSIIGASGSGKSTLLRCINLLETLTTGEILFHGQDVTKGNINQSSYRAKVVMVFLSTLQCVLRISVIFLFGTAKSVAASLT